MGLVCAPPLGSRRGQGDALDGAAGSVTNSALSLGGAASRCAALRCELRAASCCAALLGVGGPEWHARVGQPRGGETLLTRSRGGPATGRCGGHAQVSRQAKHYAHRGINALMSCDKAFQNPCHSAKREQKYVQQHIRICTHGVKTGLG